MPDCEYIFSALSTIESVAPTITVASIFTGDGDDWYHCTPREAAGFDQWLPAEFSDSDVHQNGCVYTAEEYERRGENAFKLGHYRILESLFSEIYQEAMTQDFQPEVDAFSSGAHRRLEMYWSAHRDAYKRHWGGTIMWLNPPISHLFRVVQKILDDEARGIIIIPFLPTTPWFHSLSQVAFYWWDLPTTVPLFEEVTGVPLPPSRTVTFRVVFFDALETRKNETSQDPEVSPQPGFSQEDERWMDPVEVAGVIESSSTPPEAERFIAVLRQQFRDVTDNPVYARDIDPALRGPFGVCRIELKEGAKPMQFFFQVQW